MAIRGRSNIPIADLGSQVCTICVANGERPLTASCVFPLIAVRRPLLNLHCRRRLDTPAVPKIPATPSLEPVISNAHLDPIELRIVSAEVRVRDMPPPAAYVQGLPLTNKDLNSPAPARDEIEIRRVS